jgi:hypothetical protein
MVGVSQGAGAATLPPGSEPDPQRSETPSWLAAQALVILLALIQEVQTLTRFVDPFTTARTRWMFGFQRRFVRRCECDTDMPHEGPLPHTSQTDAI